MSKAPRWTPEQLRKHQGLLENDKPANKKVKNARKTVVDGITFDSQLEAFCFGLLKNAGITFETQKEFLLVGRFRYRGRWVRPMVKIVDFWLPDLNIIIDTKGWRSDVYPVKEKILKLVLIRDYEIEPEILTPRTKKECMALVNQLSKTRK